MKKFNKNSWINAEWVKCTPVIEVGRGPLVFYIEYVRHLTGWVETNHFLDNGKFNFAAKFSIQWFFFFVYTEPFVGPFDGVAPAVSHYILLISMRLIFSNVYLTLLFSYLILLQQVGSAMISRILELVWFSLFENYHVKVSKFGRSASATTFISVSWTGFSCPASYTIDLDVDFFVQPNCNHPVFPMIPQNLGWNCLAVDAQIKSTALKKMWYSQIQVYVHCNN